MITPRFVCKPLAATLAVAFTATLPVLASEPPRYSVTVIGSLGEPGSTTRPAAINNSGHIAGHGATADGLAAFTYMDGLIRLASLPGSPRSQATSLNDRGWVVGSAFGPMVEPDPYRAVLWADGVVTDLGSLGGPITSAAAINNHGRIVGSSTLATGERRSFVWQAGAMSALDMPHGFTGSAAMDISGGNLIVGYADRGEAARSARPILWRDGLPQALPILSEDANTYAMKVNDAGHVLGQSFGDDVASVLWRDGQVIELVGFDGSSSFVTAFDINNLDQIVGYALEDSGHAPFLWQDGMMYRLADYLDPAFASIELITADAINDAGQIAGTAMIDGYQTAVLLTPVPTPAAITVLLVGAGIAGRRRAARGR